MFVVILKVKSVEQNQFYEQLNVNKASNEMQMILICACVDRDVLGPRSPRLLSWASTHGLVVAR